MAEIIVVLVLAYVVAGTMKISNDFTLSPKDAPSYVYSPHIGHRVFSLIAWPLTSSTAHMVVLLLMCSALVYLGLWLLHFLIDSLGARAGIIFALNALTLVPLLLSRKG